MLPSLSIITSFLCKLFPEEGGFSYHLHNYETQFGQSTQDLLELQ
jgi:hypothetical protein